MMWGRRLALIITVWDYPAPHALVTPEADGILIRNVLASRGFTCSVLNNPTCISLHEAVNRFRTEAAGSEIALIYFAGHGFEHNGSGMLIPVDCPFPINSGSLKYKGCPTFLLIEAVAVENGIGILLLDACRNTLADAGDRQRWAEHELAEPKVEPRRNILLAWSTGSGDTACDGGAADTDSPFATAFAKEARRHDLTIQELMDQVGQEVERKTNGRQRPWYKSSLNKQNRLSDLPQYSSGKLQVTFLEPRRHPLWLSVDANRSRLTASGTSQAVFELKKSGARALQRYSYKDVIVAAEWSHNGLIAVEKDGLLYLDGKPSKQGRFVNSPHGLCVAPDARNVIIYDSEGIELFDMSQGQPIHRAYWKLDWPPYGAVFSSNATAWIVGGKGGISSIDVDKISLRVATKTHMYMDHLYDICCLRDGKLAVVSSKGYIRILRPQAGEPALIDPDLAVNHEILKQEPETKMLEILLKAKTGKENLLFCDASPDMRLLAAGGAGGDVILIDVRDGAIVQTIPSLTLSDAVQGLAFMEDGTLAILDIDARVRFAEILP